MRPTDAPASASAPASTAAVETDVVEPEAVEPEPVEPDEGDAAASDALEADAPEVDASDPIDGTAASTEGAGTDVDPGDVTVEIDGVAEAVTVEIDDGHDAGSPAPDRRASTRKSTNVGPEGFPQRPLSPGDRVAPAQVPHDDSEVEDSDVDLNDPNGGALAILGGVPTAVDDDGRTWPAGRLKPPAARGRVVSPPPARPKRRKNPRQPVVGLVGLLLFAFTAAFLAWYAAAPLWLTIGHAHSGIATVVNCPVNGLHRRCADFVAADHSFTARVALLGPDGIASANGSKVDARMVSSNASTAYAGDSTSLYLRWGPSVVLMVLCGIGIAWATGASRLGRRRARWTARFVSVLAPVLLLAGMLAATY